ncbi:hypothetical protein RDI61_28900 [Pseudomonas plecoglossicida]|nr:hypothetical protein [Pseudomonas plecoglossicida]MDQ7967968.1 hypothetical protein [Pseudomonas plecoglossicida]
MSPPDHTSDPGQLPGWQHLASALRRQGQPTRRIRCPRPDDRVPEQR